MPVDQDTIHKLSWSEILKDRLKAARLLYEEFRSLPDKSAAWDDLHKLTSDINSDVREEAAFVLVSVCSSIPEEYMSVAWDDLIRLTNDKVVDVRWTAADSLDSVFSSVPEEYKSVAWDDLIILASDKASDVRWRAAYSLGSVFSSVPDKYRSVAWDDLIRLTSDEVLSDRRITASEIVFQRIEDHLDVRQIATYTLFSVFLLVPEEYHSVVWSDLQKLTSDYDSDVRMYSNYSLGKICIQRASQSKNEADPQSLLEEAILYFDKAAKETWHNHAKFCSMFYRSFNAVLFKKVYSKKEIKKYIVAAKKEIGPSESKRKLIEAVEQLAEVLEIAHDLHEYGGDWQESLKRCSDICNHVDQLMGESKNKTPTIHVLYDKNRLQFWKKTKELIVEVGKNAEILSNKTQGTIISDFTQNITQASSSLQTASDEEGILLQLEIMRDNLGCVCSAMPDFEKPTVCNLLKRFDEASFTNDKLMYVNMILSKLPSQIQNSKLLTQIDENITNTAKKVDKIQVTLEQLQQVLNRNYAELHSLSRELKSRRMDIESKNVETFTAEIKELISKKDSGTLELFVEKLISSESLLIDKIKESDADDKEKAERKTVIGRLRELPGKIKEKTSSFGKDVSKEVVVSVTASQIIQYLLPVLTTAILGVPIPTEIINILLSVKNSDLI